MSNAHPDTGYQMYLQRKAAEKRKRQRAAKRARAIRREQSRGSDTTRRAAPKR